MGGYAGDFALEKGLRGDGVAQEEVGDFHARVEEGGGFSRTERTERTEYTKESAGGAVRVIAASSRSCQERRG